MTNIIGHLVGIDEIHKEKLLKKLPERVKIIDLDNIQQTVYNHTDITKKKMIWGELSLEISVRKKQKKMIGSKRIKTKNIDKNIKNLMIKRNQIKHDIHTLWKEKILDMVDQQIEYYDKYHLLFVGSNIFPKDYRVHINVQFPGLSIKMDHNEFKNKIIFDINSNTYATNQIKYYLNKYSNQIIRGRFPLKLLDTKYIQPKFDKFIQYYEKHGYESVPNNKIIETIQKLDYQLSEFNKISDKNIYVATLYKSGDTIPVNSKMPIQGFLTRDEAISNIRKKIKKNAPIYVYELKPKQFQLLDGKLFASQPLYPIGEESVFLTPS